MIELSEPGLAAHAYALHQWASSEANLLSRAARTPQSMTVSDGEITLCGVDDPSDCATFANFVAAPSGRLASLTVNGVAIKSRLLPAGERPTVSVGGVQVQLTSAYRSVQTGDLGVTLNVKNDSPAEVSLSAYDTTYVGADGRRAKASTWFGLSEVQAGASAPLVVIIPAADVGGTISIDVVRATDYTALGTLSIPIE